MEHVNRVEWGAPLVGTLTYMPPEIRCIVGTSAIARSSEAGLTYPEPQDWQYGGTLYKYRVTQVGRES